MNSILRIQTGLTENSFPAMEAAIDCYSIVDWRNQQAVAKAAVL
jgi:hypothetical protein